MLLTTLILTTSMHVGQVPAPSAAEVRKVINYYYQGSRPILAQVVACKTIEKKDKANRHRCAEAFGPSGKKGDLVFVHITAMVPKGQTASLMVQASHNGVVRATKDISMNSSFRTRAWPGFRMSKSGRWDFRVLDESGQPLETITVEAAD